MKNRTLSLVFMLCLTFTSAAAGIRPYEYVLDEPKWKQERTDARIELRAACSYLTGQKSTYTLPDSILSDSVIPDSRIVNGGELHLIKCVQEGIQIEENYYKDTRGNKVEVLRSVSANNGQPYSLSPYHYIGSDGLVTFNVRKWIEMVLWCLNVLVSPWLWLAVILFLFVMIFHRLKREQQYQFCNVLNISAL